MALLNFGSFDLEIPDGMSHEADGERRYLLADDSGALAGSLRLLERRPSTDAQDAVNVATQALVAAGACVVGAAREAERSHAMWLEGPGAAERSAVFGYEAESEVLLVQVRCLDDENGTADELVRRLTSSIG